MFGIITVVSAVICLCLPPQEGRGVNMQQKNGAKSKTMKAFDPLFVALLSIKIDNYRADLATSILNSKTVHITCLLHQ